MIGHVYVAPDESSQPARPDVDALKPCPFCAKPRYVSPNKINPSARCVTEDCYGGRMSVVNLDDPAWVAQWNTRAAPASGEAAEGAEDFGDMPSAYLAAKAAPPKPAPDAATVKPCRMPDNCIWPACGVSPSGDCGGMKAMDAKPAPDALRSALTLVDKIRAGIRYGEGFSREECAEFIVKFSAPVPSPDGAKPNFEAAAISLGFEKMDATGNWVHPNDDCFFPRRYQSAEAIFEGLYSSPSGVGAAEPGEVPDGRAIELAHQIFTGWLSAAQGAVEIMQYATDAVLQHGSPKLAAPPVRGDREALDQHLETKLADYWKGRSGPSLTELVQWWSKERAALPVQLGAGEREAAIAKASALARRLCQLFDSGGESQRTVRARHASAIFQLLGSNEIEQRKCDTDPVCYLERCERLALSRQPPPSSDGDSHG